jgi:hypothetical protein
MSRDTSVVFLEGVLSDSEDLVVATGWVTARVIPFDDT